jgi:hypothetical protein
MPDDSLRMAAEILDKWSPALKQMQGNLRQFNQNVQKGNRETGDASKASENRFFKKGPNR